MQRGGIAMTMKRDLRVVDFSVMLASQNSLKISALDQWPKHIVKSMFALLRYKSRPTGSHSLLSSIRFLLAYAGSQQR